MIYHRVDISLHVSDLLALINLRKNRINLLTLLRAIKLIRMQDALNYLYQVKNRFVDRPAVYNRFLDIMKNFKSQTYENLDDLTYLLDLRVIELIFFV